MRDIRYGVALNGIERPVITWAQVFGSYLYYFGRRMLDGKPGFSGRGTSPVSVFHHRAERNKAIFYVSLPNHHK